MHGTGTDQNKNNFEALKALQADAPELERIEALLDRFNVFETIGFTRREEVHSRFLAFLLDPQSDHGLGTSFLEGFLRKVPKTPGGEPFLDSESTRVRNLGHTTPRLAGRTGGTREWPRV